MPRIQISPSILSADFARLGQHIQMVANADFLHIDVMDGHFVPNISFGPMIAQAAAGATDLPLDVHLMVTNPEAMIPLFAHLKPEYLTVHYEASYHLHRLLQQIKDLDIKAGVSLNPHTPVELLSPILDDIDLILVMSVNPGFGGQEFIPQTYDKIRTARRLIGQRPVAIQVDGGVSTANAKALAAAGTNILVAGSAVFNADDPGYYVEQLRAAASS